MNSFVETITKVNTAINDVVWGWPALILLVGTGVLMTVLTKFFQFSRLGHTVKETIGKLFKKSTQNSSDKRSISQFQALCIALSATIGTGNITGVAVAITTGGPGSIFWMWVAAIVGMMTNFSENVLGIFFRRRNKDGEWCGGAMYYLRDGLGSKKGCRQLAKVLAALFCVFALMASFGIGNMGQVSSIRESILTVADNIAGTAGKEAATQATLDEIMTGAAAATADNVNAAVNADEAAAALVTENVNAGFDTAQAEINAKLIKDESYINSKTAAVIIGLVLMIVAFLVIIGGLKRIAQTNERIVPFMALFYILGAIVIVVMNAGKILPALGSIFKNAFTFKAAAGGVGGHLIAEAMTWGFKRGVFSNEAGLGSSVMVHSTSDVKEPVTQGLWGIFEVFVDTIIVCTLTALVILTSGVVDLNTGVSISGTAKLGLATEAFTKSFGAFGGIFIAIAVTLFAFSTCLGWSFYGKKAWEYLFGGKSLIIYNSVFIAAILVSSVIDASLAIDLSDTFNGLMAIPNLIGVVTLSPLVVKITKNYVDRRIHGKKEIKPLLSAFEDVQAEQEKDLY